MPMPDNAQLSEDGQWWWDETAQEWQPVEAQQQVAGEPGFDFDENGLRIDAENGGVPSEGDELKAAFYLCNTGTAGGTAHVVIQVDGQDSVEWDSPWLEPGECAAPDGDGYVHGIPPQSGGTHEFEGIADPPGTYNNGRSGVNKVDL